ncbi:MAG: hypothetical protein ACC634_07310, partial [Hyphomicrobiales bacterium]
MVASKSNSATNVQPLHGERPVSPSVKRSPGRRPKASLGRQQAPAAPGQTPAPAFSTVEADEIWPYITDSWQRSVLFLDALRQRADNMLEHGRN